MSVVQVEPSRRRNEAPADSSPPKPKDPSIRPGTNHLKPTGTSTSGLPIDSATRSIIELDTSVLPMRVSADHPGRDPPNRWAMATARKWLGFIRPASGVTMPWRSASASLPVAMAYSSLRLTSDAMA